FPDYQEGELTKLRAALVRGAALARYARRLQFGQRMRLGKGEEESGGRKRTSLLSDVFEAVVGAIYLDQGMEVTRHFVLGLVEQELTLILSDESLTRNAKSRLQEWSQGHLNAAPRYKTLQADGPDHAKVFVSQVSLFQQPIGVGRGRSKQESSQAAAAMALHRLNLSAPEYEEDVELLMTHPLPELDERFFIDG
ncbi:MAG: hypothetical protein HC802_06620, partial [Caldilineaceae bacterium]|nr:hypothetical protein [Caldilineaceae bacterium]